MMELRQLKRLVITQVLDNNEEKLQKAILNVVQFWRTLEWFLDMMYVS